MLGVTPTANAGLGKLRRRTEEAEARIAEVRRIVDLPALKAHLASLENDAASDALWSDTGKAQALLARAGHLRAEIQEVENFSSEVEVARFAIDMLEGGEEEEGGVREVVDQALAALDAVEGRLVKWEMRR